MSVNYIKKDPFALGLKPLFHQFHVLCLNFGVAKKNFHNQFDLQGTVLHLPAIYLLIMLPQLLDLHSPRLKTDNVIIITRECQDHYVQCCACRKLNCSRVQRDIQYLII
ncbi:hypothetical protein B566_EDAN016957 [Ephemera danica]|nr:hypothetical protein B566_EDAN016957 [Ephemera danica]